VEPVTVTALEIKYSSGALMSVDEIGFCKTYISAKGVIRTTFERNMKYSDEFDFGSEHTLPVSVTYEYKLKNNVAAEIFEYFDVLQLRPAAVDMPACDGGSWKMTIYTNGLNVKIKGYMPPEPFGEELAERIMGLIKYEIDPMIF